MIGAIFTKFGRAPTIQRIRCVILAYPRLPPLDITPCTACHAGAQPTPLWRNPRSRSLDLALLPLDYFPRGGAAETVAARSPTAAIRAEGARARAAGSRSPEVQSPRLPDRQPLAGAGPCRPRWHSSPRVAAAGKRRGTRRPPGG